MSAPLNQQLKMFMSPREIMDGWQPLDGDRSDRTMSQARGSGSDFTMRTRNTNGATNWTRGRNPVVGKAYVYNPGEETDADLWDRKLSESQMPANDYEALHAGRSGPASFDWDGAMDNSAAPQYRTDHTQSYDDRQESFINARFDSWNVRQEERDEPSSSLFDSIQREGVRSPAHLGSQFGSQGKPQVVGGHHRIAAQNDINPDQLIPVLHHEDIRSARSTPGYKYS